MSATFELDPQDTQASTIDFLMVGFFACLGVSIVMSLAACLFNKAVIPATPGCFTVCLSTRYNDVHCPSCTCTNNQVDNAKWTVFIVFFLQAWDFFSDIALSVQIWSSEQLNHDVRVFAAAVGSIVFVVVPYASNLLVASRLKGRLKHNEAAKAYFEHNTAFFCLLVVTTGGCFPARCFVSSSCFGLSLLSSGITRYELRTLSEIKVLYSVLLENGTFCAHVCFDPFPLTCARVQCRRSCVKRYTHLASTI